MLSDSHFGFREQRSTEYIISGFEGKLIRLGVFMDYSKAFDLINHEVLDGNHGSTTLPTHDVVAASNWMKVNRIVRIARFVPTPLLDTFNKAYYS